MISIIPAPEIINEAIVEGEKICDSTEKLIIDDGKQR